MSKENYKNVTELTGFRSPSEQEQIGRYMQRKYQRSIKFDKVMGISCVIVGFLSTFIIPWIFVDLVAGVIGLTSWLIGAFSIYVLIECDFKFGCANLMLREKDEENKAP